MSDYRLYHYWRSSSSWRVRIALSYKNIPFEAIPVNLLNGESESPAHLARNPAGFVPVLEWNTNGTPTYLTESLAIIRFLEETHPHTPSLLPGLPLDRSRIWALAEIINAGTQPIQNIPVMQFFSSDPNEQKRWAQHWIRQGLETFETLAVSLPGTYSYGDNFSLADACLIPQIYNAIRYDVNFDDLKRIKSVLEHTAQLPFVLKAHPDAFKPQDFKG